MTPSPAISLDKKIKPYGLTIRDFHVIHCCSISLSYSEARGISLFNTRVSFDYHYNKIRFLLGCDSFEELKVMIIYKNKEAKWGKREVFKDIKNVKLYRNKK